VSLVSFLSNEQKLASSQTASLQRPVRVNEHIHPFPYVEVLIQRCVTASISKEGM